MTRRGAFRIVLGTVLFLSGLRVVADLFLGKKIQAGDVSYEDRYIQCQNDWPMEKVVQDARFDQDTGIYYYRCQAVAADDAFRCDPLNPFPTGNISPQLECLNRYDIDSLFKAIIMRDSKAKEICNRMCANLPKNSPVFVDSRFCGRACSLLVENPDNPGDICTRAAVSIERPEEAIRSCLRDHFLPDFDAMSKALGDGDCAAVQLNDRLGREACPQYVAFKKAYQARDAQLCGNYSLCRAMMGQGPASCEVYARAIKDRYCKAQAAGGVEILQSR